MALITAERTAYYRKLANDVDAAITRGDEMGVELLRALVPELTDAVEEINDGLRETTQLLFEGLRDEAIGLHDSALPEIAVRLHLADKPQWPAMALQCQVAQIALPPELDFESLAALNAAFAEAEAVRKPLAKLRRLVLERAPLAERIGILREVRKFDPAKPTWSEQLKAIEEARLSELRSEIAAAVKAVDAERLAACESELMSPEWTTPIPVSLTRQVQGAGDWLRLRRGGQVAAALAPTIEREFGIIANDAEALADPTRLDRLREMRNRWVSVESECRDLVFSLPQHPVVGPLTAPESLGPNLELARERVDPAIKWLAAIDANEQLWETFGQHCDELRRLAHEIPATTDAQAWRRQVEACEASLSRMSGQMPELVVAADLIQGVAAAKGIVSRRERLRLLLIVALAGAVLLLVVGSAAWVATARLSRQRRAAAIETLEQLQVRAARNELGDVVWLARDVAKRWPNDEPVQELWESILATTQAEQQRRQEFDELAERATAMAVAADAAVETRRAVPETALEPWPVEFFALGDAARDLRLKGGFPRLRIRMTRFDTPKVAAGDRPEGLPAEAADRLRAEEQSLDELVQQLKRIESDLSSVAKEEFLRRYEAIKDGVGSARGAESLLALQSELRELLAAARATRRDGQAMLPRVPADTTGNASIFMSRLDGLVRQAQSDATPPREP
jgi:hypothetical protein